jgi:hypothetical protein
MNYRNPIYTELGWIDCEIEHPDYGWIPFSCNPNDTGASFDAAALFADMQPHAAPYVPPTQEELDAMAAAAVRAERNYRLTAEVDLIAGNALRWAALSDEQRQAWADYRQALLDVPQQAGFPHNVTWPSKPE